MSYQNQNQQQQQQKQYTKKEHPPKITAKGTELPMMDMRGKPYLQVAHRLVWFREEHPDWRIKTSLQVGTKCCLASAEISDEKGNVIATSHKYETEAGFPDYIEKSETGAIGRALALIGYGTQFAPEFDEEDRLADSPVQPAGAAPKEEPPTPPAKPTTPPPVAASQRPANHAPGTAGNGAKALSEAQVKRLWAIAKSNQYSNEVVFKMCSAMGGVDAPEKLSKENYDRICKAMEAQA